MTQKMATTPTVGYWQTKLAAVVGSARPSDIEASRREWANRARDLRTVQETLVHAIPDVLSGLNTESGVESVGAMRRAAARALARAERMERAESALVRVRSAIEEARAVLTPLEQNQIYEPLKGAAPVDGWESPQGIKAAASFRQQRTQFQRRSAEREETARLALVALNHEFLEAGRTLEGTHSGATPDRPPGSVPVVTVGTSGVFSYVGHVNQPQRRPELGGRHGSHAADGAGRGADGEGRGADGTPPSGRPIVETIPILKAPATPESAFTGGECGELPTSGGLEGSTLGAAPLAPSAGAQGGVPGGGPLGGAPALGGGLMLGGLLSLFGRAGSAPAKPLEPTPLAKDAAASARSAAAAGSRPFAAAPYAGRGMGMGMGMGGAGGGEGRSGGRGGGRRTFGNVVRATSSRRRERDRRNPFEREEDRDGWLGDEGAGSGVLA